MASPAAAPEVPPPELPGTPWIDYQPPPIPDPNELIRDHYLDVGSSLILTGPTGVGKSSLVDQISVHWALGKPMLGLVPVRPLRIISFQAEQSDADIGYNRAGIVEGMHLTSEEIERVRASYFVLSHTGRTGRAFLESDLVPALKARSPDAFWLDPMFAFPGCDFKDQADITLFLRGGIQPLLRQFRCAMLGTHHANKPPQDKTGYRRGWNELDYAYAGSGTIELSNWTRAAIHIEPTRTVGVFQLIYGKRRNRIAAPVDKIKHSADTTRPFWTELTADELATVSKPPIVLAREKLLEALPLGDRALKDSIKHWNARLNIGRDVIRVALEELLESGKLVETQEHRGRTLVKYISRPAEIAESPSPS